MLQIFRCCQPEEGYFLGDHTGEGDGGVEVGPGDRKEGVGQGQHPQAWRWGRIRKGDGGEEDWLTNVQVHQRLSFDGRLKRIKQLW